MFFQRTQQSKLEARLKRGRPLPEDELVDEIVSYIEPVRPDVRTRGLRAQPQCPFVEAYIEKHLEEYGDLVAPATTED